jgi:ATP-dependent exoDNAse (exonuclease V) alpha subunit
MSQIEITDQFEKALQLMDETDRSLFITGKAGTGKSTLLAHFCRLTDKQPIILAPTGVAALNVKGQTIHSFFNFYVDVTPQKIRDKKSKPRNAKLYRKLRTIIIDEISMVRADLLDCIDVFLRMYGPKMTQPFGGVQMIFIGDLYQLPPVVSSQEQDIFHTTYQTPYFFSAQALQNFPLERIELEKVYRQKDQKFITLLNKIRNNSVEEKDMKFLNTRYGVKDATIRSDYYIILTTTNHRADEINQQHLMSLKGKLYQSPADIKGDFTKEYFPTATDLHYKIGAQIMMLNNDSAKRWVNGSVGIIESSGTSDDGIEFLRVRLQGRSGLVEVTPYTWEVFRYGVEEETIISEAVGTFTQYPFRLAWAITIHKSQGKTFDQVTIDIGRGTFAAGQIYVALSRCTSFEGIILKTQISRNNIRTDARIHEFLGERRLSVGLSSYPEDKTTLIRSAIEEKTLLEIVYLKGNNIKTTRVVHPLTLGDESFKGQRFMGMKAFCVLRQEERVFSLERILDIKKVSPGDEDQSSFLKKRAN